MRWPAVPHRHAEADSSYAANMASQWRTLQRLAENLVFSEAPKLIRQLQQSPTLRRGIKIGLDVLAGAFGGVVLFLTGSVGCGVAAMTWISIGLSLIATLLPTIPGIVGAFASLVGKTLTPAQLAEYQPLFDNAKKLRALLAELQDLTLEIIEAGRPRQQDPEPEA